MSLENILSSSFLTSLTPEQREQFEKLGEEGLRALLKKVFVPTLPEGWTLSEDSVTVVVDYDDPRWDSIPKKGGKYYYVNRGLVLGDFPKGERTGKWKVTFRWLQKKGGCTTQQALEAIAASTFLGANRAETESVIDRHPNHWWVGSGVPQPSGLVPCVWRNAATFLRRLNLRYPNDGWNADYRFLVACEWQKVE